MSARDRDDEDHEQQNRDEHGRAYATGPCGYPSRLHVRTDADHSSQNRADADEDAARDQRARRHDGREGDHPCEREPKCAAKDAPEALFRRDPPELRAEETADHDERGSRQQTTEEEAACPDARACCAPQRRPSDGKEHSQQEYLEQIHLSITPRSQQRDLTLGLGQVSRDLLEVGNQGRARFGASR